MLDHTYAFPPQSKEVIPLGSVATIGPRWVALDCTARLAAGTRAQGEGSMEHRQN